jgi:hypothetical protein
MSSDYDRWLEEGDYYLDEIYVPEEDWNDYEPNEYPDEDCD